MIMVVMLKVILSELHNFEEKCEGIVEAGIKDGYSRFLIFDH
jgi:hypothetical protein